MSDTPTWFSSGSLRASAYCQYVDALCSHVSSALEGVSGNGEVTRDTVQEHALKADAIRAQFFKNYLPLANYTDNSDQQFEQGMHLDKRITRLLSGDEREWAALAQPFENMAGYSHRNTIHTFEEVRQRTLINPTRHRKTTITSQ